MSLIHIFERGSDDVKRFENAIYDAKESIAEICEIFEDMKSQFSERSGSYGERSHYRYGERYMRRDMEPMSERRYSENNHIRSL